MKRFHNVNRSIGLALLIVGALMFIVEVSLVTCLSGLDEPEALIFIKSVHPILAICDYFWAPLTVGGSMLGLSYYEVRSILRRSIDAMVFGLFIFFVGYAYMSITTQYVRLYRPPYMWMGINLEIIGGIIMVIATGLALYGVYNRLIDRSALREREKEARSRGGQETSRET